MQKIGKIVFSILVTVALTSAPTTDSHGVIPVLEVIKQGVKKVIKAVDLMIQRLQNKTIWLQNAQKVLENKLSQLKLKEIAQWTDKQRQLYKKYYDDLWQIRNTLATYHRIAQIIQRQKQLVQQYKFTWHMVNMDDHFTKSEIDYMYVIYTGIINDSLFNLEQVLLVVNAYATQMSDAERLEVINRAGEGIDKNFRDLQHFNEQNMRLSVNRAKDEHEAHTIRKLYGLSHE